MTLHDCSCCKQLASTTIPVTSLAPSLRTDGCCCGLQDFIKQQMSERQNEKRRERERRWQEEAEEEAKLQAERQILQRQHDAEEQKAKNKKVSALNRVSCVS